MKRFVFITLIFSVIILTGFLAGCGDDSSAILNPGPTGPNGSNGPNGSTGSTGPNGPAGPTIMGSLRVNIASEKGEAITNFTVTLEQSGVAVGKGLNSSDQGSPNTYLFTNLRAGFYDVTVEVPGYANSPQTVKNVEVKTGQETLANTFQSFRYNEYAIITTTNGPWSQATLLVDTMDTVFGPGLWDRLNYSNAGNAPFATYSHYKFIYLEGGDGDDNALQAYLSANMTDVEGWVSRGGRLFINSAPWNININAPFGVTIVYEPLSDSVTAANPAHQIFNGPFTPAGTSFTGNSFSHGTITGSDLTALIVSVDNGGIPILEERTANVGSGFVLYGNITTSNYHTPQPNATNLFNNILHYGAGLP